MLTQITCADEQRSRKCSNGENKMQVSSPWHVIKIEYQK